LALQQEHKIFKRPFVLYGCDFLETMKEEEVQLKSDKYFTDESQTVGQRYN
jgi:hypothetical protein